MGSKNFQSITAPEQHCKRVSEALRADAFDFTYFARFKTAKLGLPLSNPII